MLSRLFVINAEQNLNPSNTAQLNIVQENADQFLILTECEVIKCEYIGRKTVWDITIEDEHEFFANKILVHNCFRYTVNMELNGFEKQYMLQ